MKKESTVLTDEIIEEISQIAASVAADCFKKEKKKDIRNEQRELIKRTKAQLKSYRKVKAQIQSERTFTETEKAEYRWKFVEDLVGNADDIVSESDRIIQDEEKRMQENLYSINRIENALELYQKECETSKRDEEKRRCRVIYDMYVADDPCDAQEIAQKENISVKSVYRDIEIACSILAIYLYGVRAAG